MTSPNMVMYVTNTGEAPSRFGFIVTKAVGGAVVRNTVRRRMRAACFDLLAEASTGRDVVLRALPGSAAASWATLHSEIAEGLHTSQGPGTMARRA